MADITPAHCTDLAENRNIGKEWERNFCLLAARHGRMFTPHQIGRSRSAAAHWRDDKWHSLMLPDITIWTRPGEHHEVKHKSPTGNGLYGLEHYRLVALKRFADETGQTVFYTIHNWARLGDRNSKENRDEDWDTANVQALWRATKAGTAKSSRFPSWVNGQKMSDIDGWYWPIRFFKPLVSIWPELQAAPG